MFRVRVHRSQVLRLCRRVPRRTWLIVLGLVVGPWAFAVLLWWTLLPLRLLHGLDLGEIEFWLPRAR